MKIELNQPMLAGSTQPVLLIDQVAHLTYANPAAQSMVPAFIAHRVFWARELNKAVSGAMALPFKYAPGDLPDDQKDWDVWLTTDGGSGFALYFLSLPPEASKPAPGVSGPGLIGREMRLEMRSFADSLRDTFSGLLNSAGVSGHFDLVRKARFLSERLDELAMLTEMEETGPTGRNDRIYLYSLTNQLSDELRAIDTLSLIWEVDPAGALLAPVYANRRWLTLALRTYLIALATGSPNISKVRLNFRQSGGYAVLSGRAFMDHSSAATEPAEAAGEPAEAAGEPAEAAGSPADVTIRAALPGPFLSMMVAQRILELHGAEVKLNRADAPERIDSFVINLPTSQPFSVRPDLWCHECDAFKQSVAIAEDFAKIMGAKNEG